MTGALAVLMKDAVKPNLMQTLEVSKDDLLDMNSWSQEAADLVHSSQSQSFWDLAILFLRGLISPLAQIIIILFALQSLLLITNVLSEGFKMCLLKVFFFTFRYYVLSS